MTQPNLPIVALIGRPNVGKSTLFNRLNDEKRSVVADFAGTTRDRLYAPVEWNGRRFLLLDSGGLGFDDDEEGLVSKLQAQVIQSLEEADVVVFVTDGQVSLTLADEAAIDEVRRRHKPTVLAVTKLDTKHQAALGVADFYALGLGEPIAVSGQTGEGSGDLLDAIVERLPAADVNDADESDDESILHIALVGRPNVGKSTLFNQIVGEERVVTSEVAGTTRDEIDTRIEFDGEPLVLVDTAGIRRKSKVEENVEQYSVMRALGALKRAHVVLVLIDPFEGITKQDKQIIRQALESHKSLAVVVNKWDLAKDAVREQGRELDSLTKEFERYVQDELAYAGYIPLVTASALTGLRVPKLLTLARQLYQQRFIQLTDAQLRSVLQPAIMSRQAPVKRGLRLHIHTYRQTAVDPPTLTFVVTDTRLVDRTYQRYLENRLREVYAFDGTPIKFEWVERG